MEWLRALHPDYWFFRQTRNSFERYWGEGQGWNGFFSSWFSGAFVFFVIFAMALMRSPEFVFAWVPFAVIGIASLIISFFLIPISAAVMLMGAMAREEVKNRRESHRRFNEALLRMARRRCPEDKEKKD